MSGVIAAVLLASGVGAGAPTGFVVAESVALDSGFVDGVEATYKQAGIDLKVVAADSASYGAVVDNMKSLGASVIILQFSKRAPLLRQHGFTGRIVCGRGALGLDGAGWSDSSCDYSVSWRETFAEGGGRRAGEIAARKALEWSAPSSLERLPPLAAAKVDTGSILYRMGSAAEEVTKLFGEGQFAAGTAKIREVEDQLVAKGDDDDKRIWSNVRIRLALEGGNAAVRARQWRHAATLYTLARDWSDDPGLRARLDSQLADLKPKL